MKVAILGTRGIPALYGGFETFAEELSVRLAARGMSVTVYCEAGKAERPRMFGDVRLAHVPAVPLGPLSTLLFDLRCLWHAKKEFDLVYMLGYGSSIFCFIPRLWGAEVWINMDGIEWARSKWGRIARLWFKMMESAAMRTADRLIADAEGIRRHLESRHSRLPAVSVIPYGSPLITTAPDKAILGEWRVAAGEYYLAVCRLEPENSVREILNGHRGSGSVLPLVVVGSIDSGTRYGKELMKLNNGRVRFVGPVYNKVKLQALRYHSRGYFHGHTVGGTNPSLLEALGCGNRIIAHDNIFNREVAGDAAWYFRQETDLAKLIRELECSPPETADRMKRMAQQRVQQQYNWAAVTEAYLALLNRTEQPDTASAKPGANATGKGLFRPSSPA